jgi:AraC-like DNA-binding protein
MLHEHTDPFPELPVFVHISEAVCAPNHVRDAHAHEVFELCYVLAGKGVRTIEGDNVVVTPGDIYIVRPGERHSARADPSDPYHYFTIAFAPQRLPVGSLLASSRSSHSAPRSDLDLAMAEASAVENDLTVPDQRVIHGCDGAEAIFRRILLELDRTQNGEERKRALMLIMVQTLMIELLVFVTRCSIAQQEKLPLSSLRSRAPVRSDFQELLAWLQSRTRTPPTLTEMAQRVHLSPAHLTVAFKREVGQTPLEFLTGLRIDEAARRLVDEPHSSITHIAIDLGFSTSQYFSLVFRKNRGCTPSQWRARNARLR